MYSLYPLLLALPHRGRGIGMVGTRAQGAHVQLKLCVYVCVLHSISLQFFERLQIIRSSSVVHHPDRNVTWCVCARARRVWTRARVSAGGAAAAARGAELFLLGTAYSTKCKT